MTDWTSGYIAEIDYTHGYYRELSPAFLQFALLNRGINAGTERPLRYLELGFGQGLSLNIHAAACQGEFWGTDFNPAQAANAQEMAAISGSGARIFDLSFAELAARDDLPDFDVIALHGIWSWISDENRLVIVDLVRRKLTVGGVLYISYNCTPGWSASMPLRHLMSLHADLAGAGDKGIEANIGGAVAFAQQIEASGALFFKANPLVGERLKKIAGQDRNYLAHEYFNRDWAPMPFSQVAGLLNEAKVSFAASANLFDHVDQISLNADGQKLLAGIAHPILRESVRDYLVNAQFRKDIFVKGPRKMPALDQSDRFVGQSFILSSSPLSIVMTIKGALGDVALQPEIYQPVIDALAEKNHAPKTLRELVAMPGLAGKPVPQVAQALAILTGAGHVHPIQDAESIKQARPKCKALNTHIFNRARTNADLSFLASPVIGGAVGVSRFQQLFLLARQSGRASPDAWAAFAWNILTAQGQRLVRDGATLDTDTDNLAELTAQATDFAAKRLPILQALGVA